MSSRVSILNAIKSNQPAPGSLPDIPHFPYSTTDPLIQFSQTLRALGGESHQVSSHDDIIGILKTKFPNVQRIVSTLPGFISFADAPGLHDGPHTFANVDLAIIPGHFAVAENGAIWITDELIRERALPFIAEHLVVVVPQDQIVATMHDAYARIGDLKYNFGTFISGPSKTADIEQSLVLGAHGAKSMTVFLS